MTLQPVEIVAIAVNAAVAVPAFVVFIECVAALWPPRRRAVPAGASQARVAVLVPAHNEESAIAQTVGQIRSQLEPGDRLLVIADNCSDRTAALAREAGAEVLERFDDLRRGKGFALAHGMESLKAAPPELIAIIDADTRIGPGTLAALRSRSAETGRPMQAVYLLETPPDAGPTAAVSAFAFLVKNLARPAGLARLGIPCQLLGTGMLMPWSLIDINRLATGNIVEDMQLGIDLAVRGRAPELCPEASVTGMLPTGQKAAFIQRTRWEHGHLGTLITQAPRLSWHALKGFRPALLGMALDLAVPPLALLCMMVLAVAAGSAALALRGYSRIPVLLSGVTGGMIGGAVLLAWARHARGLIPGRTLLFAPLYMLWKIPLYAAFLFRRQKAWVRTPREVPAGTADAKEGSPGSP